MRMCLASFPRSAVAAAQAAEAASCELRQRLDDAAAEGRVMQESVKVMRQECTERWVGAA